MTRADGRDLRSRRALVTGGAVRVGRAICLALAATGYRVAVHYRASRAAAEDLVEELTALGTLATAVQADLALPQSIPPLFADVAGRLGGLDLLVNSAAVFPRTELTSASAADWDATFAVNARASFLCSLEAERLMRPNGGSIVNIADVAAFEAWPAYVPYAASKAALVSLTRGLARAWAPGIRVNAVAPGAVLLPEEEDTGHGREAAARRAALGRVGTAEAVAQAVLHLDRADYVTGEVIRVDGGQHLM